MIRIVIMALLCPALSFSQGVKWTTGLSWEQVKQKAKDENKYIFLDCYTTWCGPCKAMDKYVYANDTIGQFFNINYISVRVQFDQTKNDNEEVKAWYPTVKDLNERYVIEGYPTFLFFTPNGEAAVKESGYKEPLKFVKLADWALVTGDRVKDIYEKYTRLIREFKNGNINYAELPFMVTNAKKRGDTISKQMLRVHEEYVSKLAKKERYSKKNIEFWSTLNLTQDRKIVQFFYKDARIIDRVMDKQGYAAKQVDKSIQNFTVAPFIYSELVKQNPEVLSNIATLNVRTGGITPKTPFYGEADWNKLYDLLRKDFSKKFSRRNINQAKATWYEKNNNWSACAKATFERFRKFPPDLNDIPEANNLNTICWNLFLTSNDAALCGQAIVWMEKLVRNRDDVFYFADTYANLLYKMGKKKDAIEWQEKAVSLNPELMPQQEALAQMKRGEPTYGVKPIN